MKVFYINLDTATVRKNKFEGKQYCRFRAFTRDEVPEILDKKMTSMYNYPRANHLSRCACWLSHTQLLEKIVKENLEDVLILEDDAIQVNPIPIDYPKDGIVYVGGFIYNKKMMIETPPEITHKKGINLCPPEYRILGTLAYIIPTPDIALKILNRIYSSKRYKAIDIMYGNLDIKQYYNYPGSFREEGCPSQISPNKNKIQTEDYEFISINKYKRCQHIMDPEKKQVERKKLMHKD